MDVIEIADPRTGSGVFHNPAEGEFDEPGEIVTALLHAAGLIRHRLSAFLERFDLSEGRYSVLQAVHDAGPQGISQSEVADFLMQSESNISSLIERLHRDGLVDRRWSSIDRRKRVLLLTINGQQLVDHVETARRRWAESILSGVAPPLRQGLALGLKSLNGRSDRDFSERAACISLPVVKSSAVESPSLIDHAPVPGRDPNSPQFALERMLSTLGLAGRFAGGEQ